MSVKLNEKSRKQLFGEPGSAQDISSRVIKLICAVDVEIEYADKINDIYHQHKADWFTSSSEDFLNELFAPLPEPERKRLIEIHGGLLRQICDESGTPYGRAALSVIKDRNQGASVSVGGFVTSPSGFIQDRYISPEREFGSIAWAGLIGVIFGETEDAARRRTKGSIPPEVMGRWASDQASLLSSLRMLPAQAVSICHQVKDLGGDSSDLPFSYVAGNFVSYADFEAVVSQQTEIALLMNFEEFRSRFTFRDSSNLTTPHFTTPVKPNVISLPSSSLSIPDEILDADRREELAKGNGELNQEEATKILLLWPLRFLHELIAKHWDGEYSAAIRRYQIFDAGLIDQPPRTWCLLLRRNE